MDKKYIIIGLILIVLMASTFFLGRYTMQIKTITIKDSVYVPTYVTEIDTVKIKQNLDSLWLEAKAYWDSKPRPIKTIIVKKEGKTDTVYVPQNINYVAELDTTYSDNLLKLKLAFVSPLPLHPKSYFRIDAISKYTEPVIPKSWFKNRFIIYAGTGWSSFSLNPSYQVGIGIALYRF